MKNWKKLIILVMLMFAALVTLEVAGSTAGKNDKIEREGFVMEALPNYMFRVRLANGDTVTATTSARLRVSNKRIFPGDIVFVEMNQNDPTKGTIISAGK